MTAKKAPEDKTLETLYLEPRTIPTSLGEIEVNPYKLKHIARITKYVSEIARAINFDPRDTAKINEIDFGYVLYVLGADESRCLMDILECATGKDAEELGELSDDDSISLLKATLEIAVMPLFQKLGKELKSLSGAISPPGPTT